MGDSAGCLCTKHTSNMVKFEVTDNWSDTYLHHTGSSTMYVCTVQLPMRIPTKGSTGRNIAEARA